MLLGCRSTTVEHHPLRTTSATVADVADAAARSQGLEPLRADSWLEHIEDLSHDGGRDAEDVYIAVPLGATEPRPVVVGIHGAGDHPGNACAEWNGVFGGFAFVVCPHGYPVGDRAYSWESAEVIAARAERAVEAARGRFGSYVAKGRVVYAGFSQGATLASRAVAAKPGLFGPVALAEIGHTPLDLNSVAIALRRAESPAVLVGCTTKACDAWSEQARSAFAHVGLPARFVGTGARGHVFDDTLGAALAPNVVWLVGDDARWRGVDAALERRWGKH
jgi:hypothetical protein